MQHFEIYFRRSEYNLSKYNPFDGCSKIIEAQKIQRRIKVFNRGNLI